MKLKRGLIMREIAGEYVVLAAGDEVELKGMITLNETGATLWKKLEEGAELSDLTAALLAEYDVDESIAAVHAEAFADRLKELALLD